jgi:hypothetical protein
MDKELIDSTITKLRTGWLLLRGRNKPEIERLGINLLEALLDGFADEEDSIQYICQQIIITTPSLGQELFRIIRNKYPQHQEYVQKLLILA